MQQHDFNKLKGLAKYINQLIASGKWNRLAKQQQNALKSTFARLFTKVQRFIAKRRLVRSLGAALTLISSNALAQSFADPILSPFGMENNTYFAKPEFIDLDGDGDLDFFHNNIDESTLYYQENTGTADAPAFSAPLADPFGLELGLYAFAPIFGDIDNDGDLDLVTVQYFDGEIVFFENIGTVTEPEFASAADLTFSTVIPYSYTSDLIDIDDDGDLDLFMTTYDYDAETGLHLHFFENTGTPESANFADPEIDPFGINFTSTDYYIFLDFADLDSDGDLDFIRTEGSNQILFYHENIGDADSPNFAGGTGTESPFGIDPLVGDAYFFAPSIVDIDNDGDLDLFVSEPYGGTFFFENTDDGSGISDTDLVKDQISLFPSPANDLITLSTALTDRDIESIQIKTIDGRQVFKSDVMVNSIHVADFPAGIYILSVNRVQSDQINLKFIKN